MNRQYSVSVSGKHAGKVVVQRQGLYYYFSCRCQLPDNGMYRLIVSCGTKRENLGILIPQGESFILDKRLPVKRIGNGELSFSLIPKKESVSGTFVPISPEEPFTYISRLKKSFLIYRNGQPGILIDKMQEQ